MAKYKKVQFIAFNIRPGYKDDPTKPCLLCGCPNFQPFPPGPNQKYCQNCWNMSGNQCSGNHKSYLGDTDPAKDIEYRCNFMKEAIKKANSIRKKKKTKVGRKIQNIFWLKALHLKVFMAPEFYFRGSEGGYTIERVHEIMEKMREETGKKKYKNWLFIYGTAIGYQKHEETLSKIHKKDEKDHFHYEVENVSRDIVEDCTLQGRESGVSRAVKKAEKKSRPDSTPYYDIELKAEGFFKDKELVEIQWPDQKTEIFNIALAQKGGPGSKSKKGPDSSREVIVYKEHVSLIDFLRDETLEWDTEDGRKVAIHGEYDRTLLPTEGSRDLLSKKKNVPGETYEWTDSKGKKHTETISEESKSGLGGGSVFTIDNITFGLEVCLDHAENRLQNYFEKNAGKEKPHIHLIPSWGMTILGGQICCRDEGLVFNVDGSESKSELRIMKDSTEYRCTKNKHTTSAPGTCPECIMYKCSECNKYKSLTHFKTFPYHTAQTVYYCPSHGEFTTNKDNCNKCGVQKVIYEVKVQPTGTIIQPTASVPVKDKDIKNYFENDGKIVAYEPVVIPE